MESDDLSNNKDTNKPINNCSRCINKKTTILYKNIEKSSISLGSFSTSYFWNIYI